MNVCTCECVLKILILNVNTQFTDIGRPRVVDFILTCQIPLTFQSKWRTLTLTHVWLRNKHYLVLWTNQPIFETSLLYRAGGYCNILFHISAIQNSFQCRQKKLYIYTNAYFSFHRPQNYTYQTYFEKSTSGQIIAGWSKSTLGYIHKIYN